MGQLSSAHAVRATQFTKESDGTSATVVDAVAFTDLLRLRGVGCIITSADGTTARIIWAGDASTLLALCKETRSAASVSPGHLEALLISDDLLFAPSRLQAQPSGRFAHLVPQSDDEKHLRSRRKCRCLCFLEAYAVLTRMGVSSFTDAPLPSWWAVSGPSHAIPKLPRPLSSLVVPKDADIPDCTIEFLHPFCGETWSEAEEILKVVASPKEGRARRRARLTRMMSELTAWDAYRTDHFELCEDPNDTLAAFVTYCPTWVQVHALLEPHSRCMREAAHSAGQNAAALPAPTQPQTTPSPQSPPQSSVAAAAASPEFHIYRRESTAGCSTTCEQADVATENFNSESSESSESREQADVATENFNSESSESSEPG
jgi:hypothetical protein